MQPHPHAHTIPRLAPGARSKSQIPDPRSRVIQRAPRASEGSSSATAPARPHHPPARAGGSFQIPDPKSPIPSPRSPNGRGPPGRPEGPASGGRARRVSRVLSTRSANRTGWAAISLPAPLPTRYGGPLPVPRAPDPGPRRASVSVPAWACTRWGLPCPACHHAGGALLPHPFTLACADASVGHRRFAFCGTFPRRRPPPIPRVCPRRVGVTHHPALPCSDFPRRRRDRNAEHDAAAAASPRERTIIHTPTHAPREYHRGQ